MLRIIKDVKFLKRKSSDIVKVDDEVKNLIAEIGEAMKENNGVGLAAPQVGFLKKIIVIKNSEGFSSFINPVILKKSREKDTASEGCLSLPDVFIEIRRPKRIKVEFLDIEGRKKTLSFDGIAARIFQHEVDHLNGILITDRIPFYQKIKRGLARRK